MSKADRRIGPPRLFQWFFEWWARKADVEDLIGDIEEYFYDNLDHHGRRSAQFTYVKQVLSLTFSYALKRRKRASSYSHYFNINSFAMFKNYFKIAFRNFSKHKFFTSINIIGLALGMSISLLALSMMVAISKSDQYNSNKDRIHQINTEIESDIEHKVYGSTFHGVGDYIQEEYPFVEQVVKVKNGFNPTVIDNGNELSFRGYFASDAFLELFEFPMVSGNPHTALQQPFSIVLTESVAQKLFRDEEPMGQVLETANGKFTVTGIVKDLKQTHLYFEVLTSHQTYTQSQSSVDLKSDWIKFRSNYVYLLLKEGTEKETLSNALVQLEDKAAIFNPELSITFQSMVLDEIVPRWNISNALGIGWDYPSLIFFMAVGLLILMPAVFNYTNLSIARALKRGKEIGIRKVVGAEKGQIKTQFLVETILLTLFALLGGLLIFQAIQQEFLSMIISASVLDTSIDIWLITVFFLFAVLIGVVSGIFPALYFSRLNPLHTLKGSLETGSNRVSQVKKGLFVFQFFMSLVFMIGVSVLSKEYAFVLNDRHGFESDNILAVSLKDMDRNIALSELAKHPSVKSVTTTSDLPGLPLAIMEEITPNDQDSILINQIFIGPDFIQNMDMKMVWGEVNLLDHSTANEELVVVNEEFMRSISVFNFKEDSLTFTSSSGRRSRVVGVMEDFNFEPLNELIRPLVFRYSLEESNFAILKINSENIQSTIEGLDEIWEGINQKSSFEAVFLDDEIEKAYRFLTVQIKFFGFLSAMAITISCLGLLGMISYTTENRTKEIAIRKIMGASTKSLYYLLTKDFVKLILIASAIAIPFSYIFYDQLFLYFLLRYGTGLGVLEVLFSVGFLFLVGFASIYWQTSKVTKANPATKLRYE